MSKSLSHYFEGFRGRNKLPLCKNEENPDSVCLDCFHIKKLVTENLMAWNSDCLMKK
jgi:hypothetical protein